MPGTDRSKAIAVIGMSCRLPGAPGPAAFWDLLRSGRDAITDPPDGREGRRRGGYLDQVDAFDADFFGISPREAAALDPQQRLLLELAWEAVEDARIAPGSLRGSRTAVITGAMADDYGLLSGRGPATPYTLTGVSRGLLSSRISHHLGLTGPSLSVDTGQSSSLFSVHLAAESLRRGEARLALAGGVQLNLAAEAEQRAEEFGALSPDDRCRTFDARADGYVRGEGGGLVLLKPLADALGDGDRVYCVILGSAASHGTGPGLTVPSEQAQAEVLRLACAQAGAEPSAVQYVELHGTGTAVGDPVEAAALGAVLGAGRPAGHELLAGSAKTNIGHLEGAAGVAGLIKAALSVAHRQIPASLNFRTPALPLAELGLRVADQPQPWPGDGPQLAGVSSFGMGGANCHVILGGPPPATAAPVPGPASPGRAADGEGEAEAGPWYLPWVLSGRTDQALRAQADQLAGAVSGEAGQVGGPAGPGALADTGLSLATTRTAFGHRAAVVAADQDGFLAGLRAVAEGSQRPEADPDGPGARVLTGQPAGGPLAVLFPGQGTQRPGMGRDLHAAFPAFARAFDAVCAEADQHLDRPLRDVMWAGSGGDLEQTQYTQPAVFAMEVALYRLWESWGVRPGLLAGHSIGEIAAAHVAGVFSLADAVTFVTTRGRLMQALPPGTMIALQATEDEAAGALGGLGGRLAVAAVNGPTAVVISGEDAAAQRVADQFREKGRRARPLKVSHAFHSPLMDPVLAELESVAARLTLRPAQGPAVVSCVTGQPAGPDELASPAYWAGHARQPVRFAAALAALHGQGARLFLEGGPGHAMTVLARAALPDGCAFVTPGTAGQEETVAALASLHLHGAEPDWPALFGPEARRVDLPGYPFQRSRHWLGTASAGASRPAPIPRSGAGRDGAGPPPPTDDGGPDREAGQDHAGSPTDPAPSGGLAGLGRAARDRAVGNLVVKETADLLGHADPGAVDPQRAFNDLGFDSRMAVELRTRLVAATGLDLPADLLFGSPTVAELTAHMAARLAEKHGDGPEGGATNGELEDCQVREGAGPLADEYDRVAIVAMGCRYPGGVTSPDELWRLAAEGTDAITPFPANRGWDLARLRGEHGQDGASATQEGGFLADADQFDAAFFGINPREAAAMDPQQRVLLETVWDAFERYGLDLPARRGQPVGVFAGLMDQDYGPRMHEAGAGAGGYRLTGGSTSVASGRIAYLFGLEGPAVTVNTACSSSLVSLHLAAQSVARGECDLAVAAGVTVMAAPGMFVDFTAQGGLAPDGRCKPFSAAADGTAWSEGAGVLVLERLADARRNGHHVLAVLAGSATNQDGASNGLSAPSGRAQEKVIRRALTAAGLGPGQVDAVEAHGTGTPLGDTIEARALTATYGQDRPDGRRVLVGSLKSSVGHTQAAAGAGGVIKMVEALRRGWLPPTLHAGSPTTEIDWAVSGLALLTEGRDWPDTGQPRRAAVSSFGISGTNAHVILEQAPASDPPAPEPAAGAAARHVPWVLSARSAASLRSYAGRLREFAATPPGADPADIAVSLAARPAHPHRAVLASDVLASDVLASDQLASGEPGGFAAGLAALAAGGPAAGLVTGTAASGKSVFVFPGQGSQWDGMAAGMMAESPVFRAELDRCAAALEPHTGWDVRDVLTVAPGSPPADRVDVIQPVLFAVMMSLAAVWRSLGVEPDAVIGHSQGEIAAACVAGVLSLDDAARVVALRSRALRRLAGTGGMVSVPRPAAEAGKLIARWDGKLHVAALNGPGSTVVAGPPEPLAELLAHCEAGGLDARRIDVDYASHTPAVAAIEEELAGLLAGITPRPPRIPLFSTLTGEPLDGAAMDAGYWYANLASPVRFEPATRALLDAGHRLFIEVSPHPVLALGVQETAEAAGQDVVYGPSLRRDHGGTDQLIVSAATAWTAGQAVNWEALLPPGRQAELPAYAFDSQRYWLDTPAAARPPAEPGRPAGHPLLPQLTELAGPGGLLLAGSLSVARHPWLADHQVGGDILLPGTALADLAMTAAERAGGTGIEELILEQPLILPADGEVAVQVTAGAAAPDGTRPVTVHSRPGGEGSQNGNWSRHASGTLSDGQDLDRPASSDGGHGEPWPTAGAEPVDLDELYGRLTARGYGYGPAFRGLNAAWRDGSDLLAEVTLPDSAQPAQDGYRLHPALLDPALHLLLDGTGPGDREGPQDGVLLPFCWTGLVLAGPGVTSVRVRISPDGQDGWTLAGAAPDGQPVVTGTVTLRPQAAETARQDAGPQDALLRVEWQPQPEPRDGEAAEGQAAEGQGDWITVGAGVPGVDGARVPELAAVRDPVPGVVICPVTGGDKAMPAAAGETVAAVLGMVQDWLGEDRFAGARLVLVTSNAVAAAPGDRVGGLAQAPVWGLIRSAQAEHPDRLSLLDLDARPAPGAVRAALAAGAEQAAVRGDQVLVPRLAEAGDPPLSRPSGGKPWRLDTEGRGLDRLVLRDSPEATRPLEPGQVRISVRAAGLNFRDITIATGLLPGEKGLGIEGAGVITETGPGVTHLAPGDAVLGLMRDAFGPVAVADARALARIPDGWSFAQAAAVPVTFLTAYDALAEVAAVQPGDSVLVHAAAGGVGLAATQVARHLGATVFGTASPGKQAATGLPDGHVASSRSLEFESQLRGAAGPAGLDVVLNCLAGEYTDASLRLLATGGRFVEIGKTDLRDPAEVARAHPGVRYQAYNLMDLPPERAGLLLREVLALLQCGALTLPPVTAWDLRRAPEAFAHMRHARHTGKIVLTIPPALDPDGTVLVTGGTGTLGALAARYLITAHGARKVLLTSRRGPDAPGAAELADGLRKLGADVRIAACDVADRDSLAGVLGGTRLTAVVHAAGVLDDGLVTSLTPSRLARVLAPKADAAWLLHELTAGHDLAAFVLFSSASGILGEPGQANYAAASTSLDALAQYRRARGLPGTSLAWGVWQERSGMTGHLTEADLDRLGRTGMGALPPDEGLALLGAALASDEALAVPMRLAPAATAGQVPAVLRELAAALPGAAPADTAPAGTAPAGQAGDKDGDEAGNSAVPAEPAPAADDQEQLLDLVRQHAAAALGYPDAGTVGADQAFRDLGFDSLTGVELRNRLSSSTGLRLPAGLISDNPTPAALTEYLRGRLASAGNPA